MTSLLNRFEGCVETNEAGSTNAPIADPTLDRFEALILRLEGGSKGSGATTAT